MHMFLQLQHNHKAIPLSTYHYKLTRKPTKQSCYSLTITHSWWAQRQTNYRRYVNFRRPIFWYTLLLCVAMQMHNTMEVVILCVSCLPGHRDFWEIRYIMYIHDLRDQRLSYSKQDLHKLKVKHVVTSGTNIKINVLRK